MPTVTELRLQSRNDRLEIVRSKHESLLAERGDTNLSDTDKDQIRVWREEQTELNEEIEGLLADKDSHDRAMERSRDIRRAMSGGVAGVDETDNGIVYRDFNAYAFDYFITRTNVREAQKIARQWGVKDEEIQAAAARLDIVQRTPANTLSSNVGGLTPPQHIAQIFQIINKDRALVNAGTHADLERGTLTYPVVTTSPVVAVQSTQKTEAGNTGMVIDMVTATATTYLGGGDLSWQAINWSTPSALRLWFDLVAADYALKTETDAATVVSASAYLNNVASPIATSADFATFMAGVGAGYSEVWANSGRVANSIIIAPDRFGYLLGMTSAAFSQFVSVGQSDIGPLNVIVSRGLNAGEVIVGDVSALLVAETPGAPVEMQVVEPAIGGVEVGIIGAFEAAVTDDGAFALVSTAS